MEKIFILIPWFHPAYKAGGPIQSIVNMVKELTVGSGQWAVGSSQLTVGSGEFSFNIFTSNKDLDGGVLEVACDQWISGQWIMPAPYTKGYTGDNEVMPALMTKGSSGDNAKTRIWYSSSNDILPVLKREIKEQKPDHFFVVGLYDWNYNFKPLLFTKGVNKIISVRGMLHPEALAQKPFKKKIYLWLWKLLGWHKKHLFHATDDVEAGYIKKVFGSSARVAVAGNFPLLHECLPMPAKQRGVLKLVSVALISPMKNYALVLMALQAVGSRLPIAIGMAVGSSQLASIEYNIYGPIKDGNYWEECKKLIRVMPPHIVINYHGAAPPDDIKKALAANHVFILPSKSENYGHSIIEALSAGRPVITSQGTPWNRLSDAKAGINVDVGDISQLVDAIDRFVQMDQAEMEEWSREANTYAVNAVDVEAIKEQYRKLFGLNG